MKLLIQNGQLLDSRTGQVRSGAVLIEDQKIVAVGEQVLDQAADRVFDADGAWISPGFIDLCCFVREPGDDQKGTLASETRAAAHGGFTTVCASPESSPVNDSGAVTTLILERARKQGCVRVLPVGALTRGLQGELLSDMASLARAGCVALSNGSLSRGNARVLRRCMAYAKTFGLTLFMRPENPDLAADGYAHEGVVATRLGLPGIPGIAETIAVGELIQLAEDTGVRLHLSQLSAARSVALLRSARERGVPVTADVAIQQLAFNEGWLADFDSRFHCRPPLRTEADRQGLLAAVNEGWIDAIVSQHQPHDPAAKQAPFGETEPGLSTVESLLGLGLKLVNAGELELPRFLQALTLGPAQVLNLPEPRLEAGSRADLTLFNPNGQWIPAPETLLSAGKHAPVLDQPLPGRVMLTLSRGKVAYADPQTEFGL